MYSLHASLSFPPFPLSLPLPPSHPASDIDVPVIIVFDDDPPSTVVSPANNQYTLLVEI